MAACSTNAWPSVLVKRGGAVLGPRKIIKAGWNDTLVSYSAGMNIVFVLVLIIAKTGFVCPTALIQVRISVRSMS